MGTNPPAGAIIDYVLRTYGNGRLAPDPTDPHYDYYMHWMHYAEGSGMPALIIRINGELDTVLTVSTADGLITGLYAVRNPEKLSHMERETALRR